VLAKPGALQQVDLRPVLAIYCLSLALTALLNRAQICDSNTHDRTIPRYHAAHCFERSVCWKPDRHLMSSVMLHCPHHCSGTSHELAAWKKNKTIVRRVDSDRFWLTMEFR
jgi:hypothetical protein